MGDTVDAVLIQLFNQASGAGRAGDALRSVELYREVLRRADDEQLEVSDEFIATARMQCAFSLMDLARYAEAETELLAAKHRERALGYRGQYELYFALGNTVGQLGRVEEAFFALVEAISRAESMDDYTDRPLRCWLKILEHAEKAKDWAFLTAKADIALNTGRLRGMTMLQVAAVEAKKLAARKLGGGASGLPAR